MSEIIHESVCSLVYAVRLSLSHTHHSRLSLVSVSLSHHSRVSLVSLSKFIRTSTECMHGTRPCVVCLALSRTLNLSLSVSLAYLSPTTSLLLCLSDSVSGTPFLFCLSHPSHTPVECPLFTRSLMCR